MSRSDPPAPTQPDAPDDLAALAVEVFQPHYAERLSLSDGRDIDRNMADVLLLLSEWRAESPPAPVVPEGPAPDVTAPPETVSGKPIRRRPKQRRFPPEVP